MSRKNSGSLLFRLPPIPLFLGLGGGGALEREDIATVIRRLNDYYHEWLDDTDRDFSILNDFRSLIHPFCFIRKKPSTKRWGGRLDGVWVIDRSHLSFWQAQSIEHLATHWPVSPSYRSSTAGDLQAASPRRYSLSIHHTYWLMWPAYFFQLPKNPNFNFSSSLMCINNVWVSGSAKKVQKNMKTLWGGTWRVKIAKLSGLKWIKWLGVTVKWGKTFSALLVSARIVTASEKSRWRRRGWMWSEKTRWIKWWRGDKAPCFRWRNSLFTVGDATATMSCLPILYFHFCHPTPS